MNVGYMGYLEDVEFGDLDDLLGSDNLEESTDICIMEHLLYGYYYEKDDDNENRKKTSYLVEDWFELWEAYVEGDKDEDKVWKLKNSIASWNQVEYILQALDCINAERPELFSKLFTSNFVSCLLFEFADNSNRISLDERKLKMLAKWVQNHKRTEFCASDFWNVVEKNLLMEGMHFSNILCDRAIDYSKLWRVCCQKPIYLSLKNRKHRTIYESMNTYGFGSFADIVEDVLNICDGVINNEKISDLSLLERFLEEDNTELLYKSLKKNVINKCMAKEGIEKVIEMKKNHFIPMIMLKINGEWE